MERRTIEDAQWRELPARWNGGRRVPDAIRARARLAQSTALRDMLRSWRSGGLTVTAVAPRLRAVGSPSWYEPAWQAASAPSHHERAQAAERQGLSNLLDRPSRGPAPLRSI
jgi:hypothetical protein